MQKENNLISTANILVDKKFRTFDRDNPMPCIDCRFFERFWWCDGEDTRVINSCKLSMSISRAKKNSCKGFATIAREDL